MHDKWISLPAGTGGNGKKAYRCSFCNSMVTSSDRIISIDGSSGHCFTNPTGLRCEFRTFSSCPGALSYGHPTIEHSWFPEYRWSLALCRQCKNHLGWHYTAVSEGSKPREFWGLLRYHVLD
jgi:hypothetical protein